MRQSILKLDLNKKNFKENAILKTLNDLTKGQTARISCYMPKFSAARRLMELGLMPGTMVRFVKSAPLGDPIALEVEGRHLSLRRSDAAQITVQAV